MQHGLARILTLALSAVLLAAIFPLSAGAAESAKAASVAEAAAAENAAARTAGAEEALPPAPIGQRHIVLLRPVVPRSMPPEVIEEMTARLVRDFHVPLNETLRAVVYASDDGVRQTMKIIYSGKGKLASRMREAAEATDADYIAGFVVTNYEESSYRNWKGDLILHSYVSLQLIGYDRERDLVIDLPASRSYNGEYTRSGTARILVLFELDRLMDEAAFPSTLFPVTDWIDKPRGKSADAK
nr:hypothetical protein [uncultured Selenomonas sp.]